MMVFEKRFTEIRLKLYNKWKTDDMPAAHNIII